MALPKLMILGASQCQVPIIQQAQGMGFEVLVVSIKGNYPGFLVADRFFEADVRDRDRILKIAQEHRISGILTDQTDLPVPTVAYVAEQLGLPGIGSECAKRFTHKSDMRRHAEQIGIPVPQHVLVSSFSEAVKGAGRLGFPLIVKPVDSQGSRGVVKVEHPEGLESAFRSAIVFSAAGEAILEEYFAGREIVIEGFMSNDRFSNLIIGDREYFDLPDIFIPSKTIFPSSVEQGVQRKLLDLNTRLVRGFAPKFGITHSEFLINEQTGEVRLVETAIRGGGVFISSDLIPLASHIDANRLLLEHAAGLRSEPVDSGKIARRAAAYLCFYLPEGRIRSIEGAEEVKALPGVHRAVLDELEVGGLTVPMTDKTMRKGPILVKAENNRELAGIIRTVQNTLRVQVETPGGIRGMVW